MRALPIQTLGILLLGMAFCLYLSPRALASTPNAWPGEANAILSLNVEKMLQSPLARKLEWQSKLIKGQADRPLAIPATAQTVIVAAGLHPASTRSLWEAAIITLPSSPNLEKILARQGGYLDEIDGKRALWTPHDTFYVELASRTLGIVRPGARQYVMRWVSGNSHESLSDYLQSAQEAATDADVLFAIDLKDAIGLMSLRYAYELGDLPSLDNITESRDGLMRSLASVRGMRMTMNASETLEAELVVDFQQDISALGTQAKPLLLEVLKNADLYESALESWDIQAKGNKITGKGTLPPEFIAQLAALLSPMDLATVDVDGAVAERSDSADERSAASGAVDPAIQASQQYYRKVSSILDSLAAQASPAQSGKALVAKARVIEQLPILNVDPALVEWGNSVASAFNQAAAELGIGQQKAMVAAAGIAEPVTYNNDNDGYYNGGDDSSRAAYQNARRQRQQVSQSQRAAAGERALEILNEIYPTRGAIRAEMVRKYGVEF